jgi:hypothetical protein
MYVPKAIFKRCLPIAPPVKSLTRADQRDCHERQDLYRLRAHAGLRSNEGFANRAIQLFGLFRVFGEQLDGSQNEQARKPQLILLLLRT